MRKLLFLLIFLFVLSGCQKQDTTDALQDLQAADNSGTASEVPDSITEPAVLARAFVYVCGAVQSPGVYELAADARVYEAITAAGGVTDDAAAAYVNQARVVEDGERIYIPNREEVSQKEGAIPEFIDDTLEPQKDSSGKVNINQAGLEELMSLTGIGETKARKIMEYREQNGSFGRIEDLMNVDGIKEGTYRKIEDRITV